MVESPGGVAGQRIVSRSSSDLSFVYDRIVGLPDGNRILECIQCGTCGGSCPVSFAMDRTPRQVINLVRSGRIAEALQSQSIWICTSCYNCTVHCPAGIKITEVMYALKVSSTELGIHHEGALGPVFADSLVSQLESRGRINEVKLILRLAFHKPGLLLTVSPRVYLRLLMSGRVKLRTGRIKRVTDLKKMNEWAAANAPTPGRVRT